MSWFHRCWSWRRQIRSMATIVSIVWMVFDAPNGAYTMVRDFERLAGSWQLLERPRAVASGWTLTFDGTSDFRLWRRARVYSVRNGRRRSASSSQFASSAAAASSARSAGMVLRVRSLMR